MASCGLELHPAKTKIVYCRDSRRRGKYRVVKFDFLGYSFQPRTSKSKQTGKLFLGYDCAISISSRKRMADKLEEMRIERSGFKSIVGIAQKLNPVIRGWINYYGRYYKSAMYPTLRSLDRRLAQWATRKYKRLRGHRRRAAQWLARIAENQKWLFAHWRLLGGTVG